MSIDYRKVLENPEVMAWAKAACPDYQDNVDSDGEEAEYGVRPYLGLGCN